MHGHYFNPQILTNAAACRTFILTLILLMFVDCSEAGAFDYYDNDTVDPNSYGRSTNNPIVTVNRSERISQMTDYAKKQLPVLAPGLPNFLRNPSSWFGHGFGFNLGNAKNSADISSSVIEPMQQMSSSPSVDAPEAFWVSPNYNHKGFLPLNDAIIMDVHLRHNMFSSPLQLELHPFYGQNWHSIDNYWGSEIAVGLGSSTLTSEPWGKIAIRFTQGDTDLMNHGHGMDMHSQLNFDDRLSLNAGIREEGNSSAGNYVMLRWKKGF